MFPQFVHCRALLPEKSVDTRMQKAVDSFRINDLVLAEKVLLQDGTQPSEVAEYNNAASARSTAHEGAAVVRSFKFGTWRPALLWPNPV
jgi:hypothetical protein